MVLCGETIHILSSTFYNILLFWCLNWKYFVFKRVTIFGALWVCHSVVSLHVCLNFKEVSLEINLIPLLLKIQVALGGPGRVWKSVEITCSRYQESKILQLVSSSLGVCRNCPAEISPQKHWNRQQKETDCKMLESWLKCFLAATTKQRSCWDAKSVWSVEECKHWAARKKTRKTVTFWGGV